MMSTLTEALQEVQDLERQSRAAKKNSDELGGKAGKKLEKIRSRIKDGESTGDRIKDFVIVRYYGPSDEIESTLRALDEKVRKHAGEFVLVVTRKEEPSGFRGIMPHMESFLDWYVDEHLFLGVLKDDGIRFNLSHECCVLPTGEHARCWNLYSEEVDLVKDDFRDSLLSSDFGRHLGEPLKRQGARQRWRGNHYQKEELALEVEVGDKAVAAWFEKQPEKRYVVIFQKMANVLGRPAPETPALQKELESRREAVRKQLTELEGKATRLGAEINRIYGSKRSGTYVSDGAITVCETDDDAFWISLRQREELKEVVQNIKRTLPGARILGMGNEELVQSMSKKYEKVPA